MWLDCGLVTSRGDPRTGPRALVALLPLLVFCGFFFCQVFSQLSAITGSSFSWKEPARTPWSVGPCLDGFGMLTDPSPRQASVTYRCRLGF